MLSKLNFSEMSDRLKLLLFVVGVALFITAFYIFLYIPSNLRLADMEKRYDALLKEVTELDGFLKAHPDLDASLLETDRVMNTFNSLLPNDANVSNFIVIINKIAQAARVNITTISPGQWVNRDKYQEMPLSLTVTGRYIDLLKFIKLIEDNPKRFTLIKSINISDDKAGGGLAANLSVTIFSWNEKNLNERF